MKTLMFFVVTLILAASVFGQSLPHEAKAINKGRIFTRDSATIDGQHMVLSADTVEYYVEGSSERYAMSLKEVNRIEEYKGDHGTTGSIVGSLLGGGIGIAVALGTKETKSVGIFEETTIQTWPIYVFTLAGGLIGYAVGASSESWDTVYSSGKAALGNFEIRYNSLTHGTQIVYKLNL